LNKKFASIGEIRGKDFTMYGSKKIISFRAAALALWRRGSWNVRKTADCFGKNRLAM